jgi:hypothetical protein
MRAGTAGLTGSPQTALVYENLMCSDDINRRAC